MSRWDRFSKGLIGRLRPILTLTQLAAFLPALILLGFWFGGEAALLLATVLVPAIFAIAGIMPSMHWSHRAVRDGLTGLPLTPALVAKFDDILGQTRLSGRSTASIMVEIDDFATLVSTHGHDAGEDVVRMTANRLVDVLREDDIIARLDGPTFGIALAPLRRADLETVLQLAARLQGAAADPISIDGLRIFVTLTIGFCLPSRVPAPTGAAFLDAAERALVEARGHGPGSIRAYTGGGYTARQINAAILSDVAEALDTGQVRPWFQPQICTDTGEISGFEALARWVHPERGLIAPADFLPAIREAGLYERLGEVILYGSLSALRAWEKAGVVVPSVAVNFSFAELSNPKLCDKIKWELDRFDFAPARLTVEILEDVIAHSDNDTITRNIWALSELGCKIDLDDFGTGHASIANIRRFGVDRIKIDRSYITRVDVDREQQNMVAAILTMAERLDLDTLAEGVETQGEFSMLAQLGCGHVQGYSIARPMPFEDTFDWIRKYCASLPATPRVDRHAG